MILQKSFEYADLLRKNISYYYQCRKQLFCLIFFSFLMKVLKSNIYLNGNQTLYMS